MKYTYSAIITPAEDSDELFCSVPDLPGCITTGRDFSECIDLITDAMNAWLVSAEDHGDPIPEASPQSTIPHTAEASLSIIQADTIAYRAATDNRAVRKNVSLPAWMVTLADKRGINCSKVLQDGLAKLLGA